MRARAHLGEPGLIYMRTASGWWVGRPVSLPARSPRQTRGRELHYSLENDGNLLHVSVRIGRHSAQWTFAPIDRPGWHVPLDGPQAAAAFLGRAPSLLGPLASWWEFAARMVARERRPHAGVGGR